MTMKIIDISNVLNSLINLVIFKNNLKLKKWLINYRLNKVI